LWSDFYELIGVANLQEQKKERVIQDEMTAWQMFAKTFPFTKVPNPRWNIQKKLFHYMFY
jgi:hypothetical protein